MTIEFKGHVKALEHVAFDQIKVTLIVDAARSLVTHEFIAKPGEVDSYKPGMPVVLQIRPDHK